MSARPDMQKSCYLNLLINKYIRFDLLFDILATTIPRA